MNNVPHSEVEITDVQPPYWRDPAPHLASQTLRKMWHVEAARFDLDRSLPPVATCTTRGHQEHMEVSIAMGVPLSLFFFNGKSDAKFDDFDDVPPILGKAFFVKVYPSGSITGTPFCELEDIKESWCYSGKSQCWEPVNHLFLWSISIFSFSYHRYVQEPRG